MSKVTLRDGEAAFEVTLLEAGRPERVVLFAVGSGGNPERHLPLLRALADGGAVVVAPHFERIISARPTESDLAVRARRLRLALDSVAQSNLPVGGVGHSIGATILIAFAGGQMWLGPGQAVAIPSDDRIGRLVLFAPPTGFFRAPKALSAVRVPIQLWAGTRDTVTPADQAEYLARELGPIVDLRVTEGVGHFSFLSTLPPQVMDPLGDRERFLSGLAEEVVKFVRAV